MRLIGLAGWSGQGKTTIAEQMIGVWRRAGLRVASVKHAHHDFDPDIPGKDSWRHRKAGASQVLVSSNKRWALITEVTAQALTLGEILQRLDPCDVVLIEGFKAEPFPKIEIHRTGLKTPTLFDQSPWIKAVASSDPAAFQSRYPHCALQVVALAEVERLAEVALEMASPCCGESLCGESLCAESLDADA